MELRPYQKECLAAIEAAGTGRHLCQLATGLGKCFARGTRILMYDGTIKNVEYITAGDLVMGVDSTPRLVSGCSHGVEKMYRITPAKGDSYTVNGSHILSLRITGLNGKTVIDALGRHFQSGDICNIEVNDYLRCSPTFRHVAKGYRSAVDFPETATPIDPYILGVWLGDGHSRAPMITTMDAEVLEAVVDYANRNDLAVHEIQSHSGKAKTYSMVAKTRKHHSNVFSDGLRALNLVMNKHIPCEYLHNGKKNRLELLAGLIDTDGYRVDNSTLEWSSSRKQLAEEMLYLCRSLGLAAYCKEKEVHGKTYWRLFISGNTAMIPCRVKRRVCDQRRQKKDVLNVGISVSPVGVGEYFGFQLSGTDRRFLLADFTVVHNTVIFSRIPIRRHTLILSHRQELVEQPIRYFDCDCAVEMADRRASCDGQPTASVVSASVQTLSRRMFDYASTAFDTIIIDEAHHAAAKSYQEILRHFQPDRIIGFTATPNRADGVGLENAFDKIIFERDLRWGIENGYLSPISCKRVNIGYDLSGVAVRMGDYAPGDLERAVNVDKCNDAIAEIVRNIAEPPVLIFAVDVAHAEAIAAKIPGARALSAQSRDRAEVVQGFKDGKVPVLVNCALFTEGTDLPNTRTVIIARPTKSNALYTQMVGRGTRLAEGKDHCLLIDCVGVSKQPLCTAPSLLGLDIENVPARYRHEIEGDLLADIPAKVETKADTPESWVDNVRIVDLWARAMDYELHGVNYLKRPDGELSVCFPDNHGRHVSIRISGPDALGVARLTTSGGYCTGQLPAQRCYDLAFDLLRSRFMDQRPLWNLASAKRWGAQPAGEKQIDYIKRLSRRAKIDVSGVMNGLTKLQASNLISRLI